MPRPPNPAPARDWLIDKGYVCSFPILGGGGEELWPGRLNLTPH